jgi:hypothetical protein
MRYKTPSGLDHRWCTQGVVPSMHQTGPRTNICDNKHYRTFKAYYTEYVLPAAQKAFSRAATSRSAGSLAYPELTLKQVESQEQLGTPRCFLW